jgi:WD40 repeat protein
VRYSISCMAFHGKKKRALSCAKTRKRLQCAAIGMMLGLSAHELSHAGDSRQAVATNVADLTEDDDVVTLQFSPDDRQLAIGTAQTLHVHLWDWRARRIDRTLQKPRPADLLFSSEGIRYSIDGKFLAIAHAIGSAAEGRSVVDIYSPQTGAPLHRIPELRLGGAYSRMEFSPDGKLLVRTFDSDNRSKTGQFLVHRTDTWDVIWSLSTLPLDVHTLALTRDATLAAVAGGPTAYPGTWGSAQILIIDLAQRKVIHAFDSVFSRGVTINVVAWHPDGLHLAAGAYGENPGVPTPPEPVKIVNAATGKTEIAEALPPMDVTGLHYTSDGRYLIECGYSPRVHGKGLARVWDGQHETLLQEIPVDQSFGMTISGDNRYFAIGDKHHVSIWTLK